MLPAKKRRILNIAMVCTIIVIVFAGVMIVSGVKGWAIFDKTSPIVSASKIGNASIERAGVSYSLDDGTNLWADDKIATSSGSNETLLIDNDNSVVLNENAKMDIAAIRTDTDIFDAQKGEVFVEATQLKNDASLEFDFDGKSVVVQDAVYSLSVQSDSDMVSVYSGSVSLSAGEGLDTVTIEAGKQASLVTDSGGKTTVTTGCITATALSGFIIGQLLNTVDSGVDFCFTNSDLNAVKTARQQESVAAVEAAAANETAVANSGGDMTTDTGSSNASGSSSGATSSNYNSGSSKPSSPTCTIEIRCDTILNNMGNLTKGKSQYVPSSGTILATSTMNFTDGETVFDVLKRACSAAGLQIEYRWTPMYNSYYIEGINNLYEFDCGSESGWMYKVNGWFPNYGCSSYALHDRDVIVWCYTCNGLGADVGGGYATGS